MTVWKRVFDLILVLLLLPVFCAIAAVVAFLVFVLDGRPILYGAERMQTPTRAFTLWKFRTMRAVAEDSGVSGGDKESRVTPLGRILRRLRLDELPQLFNILSGDMSFVGPRPPLRVYVEAFPALYADVLRARPGVTGLASVLYHRREEKLLAACRTAAETDHVYRTRCIPIKARLDIRYLRHRSLCLDLVVLGRTIRSVVEALIEFRVVR